VIEIEVTDPTHPLFGRRFPVRQIGDTQRGATHVFVAYREYMTLRIPLHMTTLIPTQPATPTKLTLDAVQELVILAEQVQLSCLHDPLTSGANCHQIFSSRSATNSDPSSKRS
jgi:hypothetical protein